MNLLIHDLVQHVPEIKIILRIKETFAFISKTDVIFFECLLRLVKGTGEILEEIVSKQQHQKINKVRRTAIHFVTFDVFYNN